MIDLVLWPAFVSGIAVYFLQVGVVLAGLASLLYPNGNDRMEAFTATLFISSVFSASIGVGVIYRIEDGELGPVTRGVIMAYVAVYMTFIALIKLPLVGVTLLVIWGLLFVSAFICMFVGLILLVMGIRTVPEAVSLSLTFLFYLLPFGGLALHGLPAPNHVGPGPQLPVERLGSLAAVLIPWLFVHPSFAWFLSCLAERFTDADFVRRMRSYAVFSFLLFTSVMLLAIRGRTGISGEAARLLVAVMVNTIVVGLSWMFVFIVRDFHDRLRRM